MDSMDMLSTRAGVTESVNVVSTQLIKLFRLSRVASMPRGMPDAPEVKITYASLPPSMVSGSSTGFSGGFWDSFLMFSFGILLDPENPRPMEHRTMSAPEALAISTRRSCGRPVLTGI